MKPVPTKAFTLVELLLLIAIIVILAAMILPMLNGGDRISWGSCMNNQKQIAMDLAMWSEEHENQFSWNVSTNLYGTKELIANGQAAIQFQPLSNLGLNPLVLVCPSDKTKQPAAQTRLIANSNISYFVNVDDASMGSNSANVILTGDRHLEVAGNPIKPGLFVYTNGMVLSWTTELHRRANFSRLGVVAYSDGHVEGVSVRKNELTDAFNRQGMASERLLVP